MWKIVNYLGSEWIFYAIEYLSRTAFVESSSPDVGATVKTCWAKLHLYISVCEYVCSTLLDIHKQVLQQRDDCCLETETLRRSATPR